MVLEKRRVRISIWAVNGSQSEVLVMRKFEIDCQGFVFGYDIEIFILYSLLIIRPCFTRKATPPLWPVEQSFRIVS